jgi:signal transduction histidine kinase/streptogramin lyase
MRLNSVILPFLISLASIMTLNSSAQRITVDKQYRVINWKKQQGLGGDGSNVMIKDAMGFLWVGGQDGVLCRFDGATFKKYLPSKNESGLINSDHINALVEDSVNNIWIGTSKGLSIYNRQSDNFRNFVTKADSINSNIWIIPFWATRDAVFCYESNSRTIVAYDVNSLGKKTVIDLKSTAINLGGVAVNSTILDTASNSLWLVDQYAFRNGGILQISLADGHQQKYTWECRMKNHLTHRHSAEAMRFDSKRNSIWLNTGDGLVEFSLSDKTFRHIDALNEFTKLSDYDRYVGIDIDVKGNIWLAAKPAGIIIYNPDKDDIIQILSPELQRKIGQDNLHVYCDREGITWTSDYMNGGLLEVVPFSPTVTRFAPKPGIRDSLSNGMIYTIVPATNGKMWLGTGDGLNIFDPETETFEVLREKDLPGIKGEAIIPLGIDTIHQKAWLNAGSTDPTKYYEMDTYEMDLNTRTCRQITFRAGSKQVDTLAFEPILVKPFKNGLLLFNERNPSNAGLFEINSESHYADLMIPVNTGIAVSRVEVEGEGLFLKPYRKLPNLFFENRNGKWIKVPHMLDSVEWINKLQNKIDKTHWVSLKDELVHYDKNFKKIRSYGPDDGYNGSTFQMVIDHGGNIWFINDLSQIGRLNVATGIFSILSTADGYMPKDYSWSVPMTIDRRGFIYVGTGWDKGVEGLDVIRANQYSSSVTSKIYLRSLTVNQQPFSRTVGQDHAETLMLRHDQNKIVLEAGIIDFHAMGKGHIRYKLEKDGEEEGWQYGPAYHSIRYDDLAPGSYRLVLQASNAGNEFNSREKVLGIIIAPPFWQTWWFRLLAVAAFISLVYAIVQFRSRSLKMRNEDLEEKVIVRTKELKQSLEDLKSTQAQLVQSEKMASLGELTAGIAHEIQNPLNFVNNFSDLNKELAVEMKTEIDKGNLEDAKAIADNIAENAEKITHHGKRADSIVKGMLEHSRSSTGVKEPTDLNALTDEYLRLAFHGLRAKNKSFNATLKTDFDPDTGKINIVRQDIGRVVLNLITNAFHTVTEKRDRLSNGSYEPTVWVTTKKSPTSVELRVKDNGQGIPPKVLDKIFQPFFTTKPPGQGVGLGLSLSYDIVKAHGGELLVETVEGEWTEFLIKFNGSY